MPVTPPSYLSTVSPERRLFQEESAANLHDKEIGKTNKKKKLSGLSVHPQPESGANLSVCGFRAPQFEERLKRGLEGGRD